MSKKTLALILSLLAVTVILLIIALSPSSFNAGNKKVPAPTPTPPFAFTTLTLSPERISVPASGSATIDVVIDTGANKIDGFQLALAFDPNSLTNVSIVPGPLVQSGTPLLTQPVNQQTGRIKYLIGLNLGPDQQPIQGKGVIAQIRFQKNPTASGTTPLSFLEETKITQLGTNPSVLKATKGALIDLGSAPVGSAAAPFRSPASSNSGK